MTARAFQLVRDEDVTGVSGTGVVAEGVEFSDGVCVVRWIGDWPTTVVHHDRGIESVRALHGHDGRTRVVFLDVDLVKAAGDVCLAFGMAQQEHWDVSVHAQWQAVDQREIARLGAALTAYEQPPGDGGRAA